MPARMALNWAVVIVLLSCCGASAERIKKPPPTPAEAEQQASDMAVKDSLLRSGDIVATGRGFLMYRGVAADGVTGNFVLIPNPLRHDKQNKPRH